MFLKKKDEFTAIKLYSIGKDQEHIDRPVLVEAVFDVFLHLLGETPKCYDIGGPYGIAKGRDVGIKSFKNKLNQKGYEKCYSLFGETENRLGFQVLFDANRPGTTYTELVFWFKKGLYAVSFKDLLQRVDGSFSVSCGFQFNFAQGFDIFVESKIKRGVFSTGVEVNSRHKMWIDDFENGACRDVFTHNLFSQSQYDAVSKEHPEIIGESFKGKYLVEGGA